MKQLLNKLTPCLNIEDFVAIRNAGNKACLALKFPFKHLEISTEFLKY